MRRAFGCVPVEDIHYELDFCQCLFARLTHFASDNLSKFVLASVEALGSCRENLGALFYGVGLPGEVSLVCCIDDAGNVAGLQRIKSLLNFTGVGVGQCVGAHGNLL